MIRLNHEEWACVQNLSLEIHSMTSEQQLIELVLLRFPEELGINYTVWHERSRKLGFQPRHSHVTTDYRNAFDEKVHLLNDTIDTHPVIVGLGMNDGGINLPEDRIVAMTDFASLSQIKETAVYRELYRHIDVIDHALVEFWHNEDNGVMICFNGREKYSQEKKLMIHVLRQHLAVAFRKFKTIDDERNRYALGIPTLDFDSLTRREREILPLVLSGKSNAEIAIILGISVRTAEKHVAAIIEKTGAENRKTLIAEARLS